MTRIGLAALTLCVSTLALASESAPYPSRAITIVVPTAPSGGNDLIARTLAQKLSPLLGQSVIVENRAGANGAIGTETVARAAPDGYTLLLGYIATHAMNPALQTLRYDPVKDFTPISLLGYSPTVMVANPKADIKDVGDLVAQLKASPDKYAYATAGNGTAPHFAGELFQLNAGVKMLGVPYKGSAPAMTDTVGGQTQLMFPSLFTAAPYIKGGQLKALAIAGPERAPSMPDIPTLKEAGVDGVEVQQWYAIFAPANTPAPVVEKLNAAFNAVLKDPDVVRRMKEHGADVALSTSAELGDLVKSELARWKDVVTKTNIAIN
ncbi:tripartite tricarboxylate transporter substrate binding protein [Achromobacter sp. GG226]|uniref:Bug family tripartite tricarboxylate transporter substrate binding protein n=1 Tax=Verticiella alkaliphila TaxID=2779529 RepID=UPI001C0BCF2E|nr:tripartite tricarboxylate transporter substrate binding protein [Verticiella sp. GG226]MBU4609057.1 tripartite tricarboxylate transporter substrate binding protein [Verticiella sp. GG226]